MTISYFDDYAGMSESAASLVIDELYRKKNLLLCAATGGSPTGLYRHLAKKFLSDKGLFERLRILKLDEWGGIAMEDPNTCQSYLKKNILEPLEITGDRFLSFDTRLENREAECERIQQEIDSKGPIDICVLGLGKNGHLGFNEPSSYLQKDCHITQLSTLTMQHVMAQSMKHKPSFGITVGMKDILQSKKVLLLITGEGKQDIIKRLIDGEITTQLPASFLWLHPNAECLIDKTSC